MERKCGKPEDSNVKHGGSGGRAGTISSLNLEKETKVNFMKVVWPRYSGVSGKVAVQTLFIL